MATPVESHVDELAFQTKIDDYGDMRYLKAFLLQLLSATTDLALFSIVTIPGCAELSPPERLQVTLKARQLHAGSSHEADSLRAALRQVFSSVLALFVC
jgi:hypothetical protein